MITFRIPAPSSLLLVNLVGLLGLLSIVLAVGLLAGWPWALLAGGVIMVGLSVIGATHVDSGTRATVTPVTAKAVA